MILQCLTESDSEIRASRIDSRPCHCEQHIILDTKAILEKTEKVHNTGYGMQEQGERENNDNGNQIESDTYDDEGPDTGIKYEVKQHK